MPARCLVPFTAALLFGFWPAATSLAAQQPPDRAARLDSANQAWRAERLAITGDLGAPELPPVRPDSPRDSMVFADRFPTQPDNSAYAGGGQPELIDAVIPAGEGGTGVDKPEVFQYQLPVGYDPEGPLLPLVVGYHGFGESAKSVAANTLLDEEANARGWLYMAPTGIDDQLFGAPVSQQATESAIQFMLDQFRADPDRIYLVGFSMGGGICANFAARRRDPERLMVAALAMVAATCDWTMTYKTGTPANKTWMENPYNFGAKPGQDPFAYQRASVLHFDKTTYFPQPLPGQLLIELSMGTNLGSTPVYLTWDQDDTVDQSLAQNPVLDQVLHEQGGEVLTKVVSGTTAGLPAQPAPHSWAVLDEVDLFDWLEGRRVLRRPLRFDAMLDRDTAVAHVGVTQQTPGAFSYVESRDGGGAELSGVANAAELALDASRLPPGSERFSLDIDAPELTRLSLFGFPQTPSRLLDDGGRLLADVASDPAAGSLALTVAGPGAPAAPDALLAQPGGAGLNVVFDPAQGGTLSVSPDPVTIGGQIKVQLDLGAGHAAALLWVGLDEQLLSLPSGVSLSVVPSPAADPLLLPLSVAGRLELVSAIPTDPLMVGQHLHAQAVGLNGAGAADVVSNPWLQVFH